MEATNLWQYPEEIGGPMEKGQEYRRNVHVLTYGFDQSFVGYFGPTGVLVVQDAVSTLNRLPSATAINVNRYPTSSVHFNEAAYDAFIMDLKLITLHSLLEEMGLTSPSRYVWTLHYIDEALLNDPIVRDQSTMTPEQLSKYMRQLNFDPVTFQPSYWISGIFYTFEILTLAGDPGPSFAISIAINPGGTFTPTVADANVVNYGLFATDLTRDDAGGLKYLLQFRNVNVESYDPSVQVRFANRHVLPRTGPHPGGEKITFVKHRTSSSGSFLPMTFKSAVYVLDGTHVKTAVATRVVSKPDILFCGAQLGNVWVQRSGTTNWINNSALNNIAGADGPGVIAGQTQITFQTNTVFRAGTNQLIWHWGNITSATNVIILGR